MVATLDLEISLPISSSNTTVGIWGKQRASADRLTVWFCNDGQVESLMQIADELVILHGTMRKN